MLKLTSLVPIKAILLYFVFATILSIAVVIEAVSLFNDAYHSWIAKSYLYLMPLILLIFDLMSLFHPKKLE